MKQQKNSVRGWLAEKVRRETVIALLSAGGLLFGGTLVLFLTFWVVYGVVAFGFHWLLPLSHDGLMITSAAVVVLLFVGNMTTDRAYLDRIELELGPHRRLTVAVARAAGAGWMLAFAGPQTARSTVKMFTTLLYTGPRMLTAAWHELQRGLRLRHLDTDACGRVLAMLLAAGSRVPFEAILIKYPALDAEAVFTQLGDIDGVVFLRSDPPGLTLAPLLTDELVAWKTRPSQA